MASIGVKVSSKKRSLIFVNIMITCVAVTLLMTALNTALPVINKEMNISTSAGQWLISGYSLAMGIIMPLTAFMMRRFKTKYMYLTGIGVVILGLIIDCVAPTFSILLAGRIIQACGNGILLSMSQVILLSIYPQEKRGMAMGWYGLAVSAAPVAAPTLGGILVDAISWRAIFGMALIIMAFAFIMAILVFENVLDTDDEHFDFISFILSIFAFGGISLGVGNLANYGIKNPMVIISLIVGIIGAVIFVIRELRMSKPFLDVHVFRSAQFTIGLLSCMLVYFITQGSSILMPQYMQTVLGHTATVSGLALLPGALLNAIMSPFAGRLYDRFGMKKLFVPGSILMIIGSFFMFFVDYNTPLAVPIILYAMRGLAIGAMLMPLVTWAVSGASPKLVSDATALTSSLRTIAGAIGNAVFVGIMTSVAASSATIAKYGDSAAKMRGVNIAFLVMAILGVVLLLMAIFLVKNKKKEPVAVEEKTETVEEKV